MDLKNHKVSDVALGRSEPSLRRYLRRLPGRDQVQAIVMDLSESYRSIARRYFPQATIVADRFLDLPASDFLQTIRRLVMAQNLAKAPLVYASYLAEPRLQDLLSRIEERMSEAAGTYKSQVDLSFLR